MPEIIEDAITDPTAEQSAADQPADVQPTPAELDQRIADVLNATDDRPSVEFYRTIGYANAAIETTEAELHEAQSRAFDPKILDPSAPGRAHDAEYRLTRLKRAVEALDAAGKKALRRERVAKWEGEIGELQREVDLVAAEVAGRYTTAANEIVSLMVRLDAVNRKVDAKNVEGYQETLPSQVSTVQLALGIASNVFQNLRLPELLPRGYAARNLWPRPEDNWVTQYHALMAAVVQTQPVRTPEEIEAEKVAEAAKWLKFHQEQEEGRLRANAEAEKIADAIRARQQHFTNGGG